MKATIECKQNCITVKTKKEAETLYDTDLKPWIDRMELVEFIDAVYDYFFDEMEDVELNFKEIKQACKKVYNSLK